MNDNRKQNEQREKIMSEALTVPTSDDLASLPAVDTGVIAEVLDGGFERMPYIKLVTPASTSLMGKGFPANNYGLFLGEDVPETLGPDVSVLPLHCKPMALDTSDSDGVFVIFRTENPHFDRIVAEASKPGDTQNYMHGVNFLLWLPEQGRLVTMFFGTKSARRVAPALAAQMRKMATLGSALVETKKFSWYIPTVTSSDAELPALDMVQITDAINAFVDAPDYEPGAVDADADNEHGDDSDSRDR